MLIPVHCCCNPELRLGFMDVPDSCLKYRLFSTYIKKEVLGEFEKVDFIIHQLNIHDKRILAIKSDDRPLDYFKKIYLFIEDRSLINNFA